MFNMKIRKRLFYFICIVFLSFIAGCEWGSPPPIEGTFYYSTVKEIYSLDIKRMNENQYIVSGMGDDAVFTWNPPSLRYRDKEKDVMLWYHEDSDTFAVYISKQRVGVVVRDQKKVVPFEKQNPFKSLDKSWKKSLKR